MQRFRIAIGEHIELQGHQTARTLLEQNGSKRTATIRAHGC
jgi:hypothetical protein